MSYKKYLGKRKAESLYSTTANAQAFQDKQLEVKPLLECSGEACLYCEEGKAEHFLCPECGAGMCQDCYYLGKQHFEQIELFDCDELRAQPFVETYGFGWLCYKHIEENQVTL